MRMTCSVEGCGAPVHARGWCGKHYLRWRKYGDTGTPPRFQKHQCSIDGCDGEAAARNWCDMHYARWLKHGDPLVLQRVRAYNGQQCSVGGCTSRAHCKGFCAKHYQRWYSNGDPLVERRAGSQNVAWRGKDADVHTKHQRIYRVRGKADHCSVCGRCDNGTWYDWANLTGNYDDIWDFAPMCRSCHRKYDKHGVGERNSRAVLTEALVREIRAKHATGEPVVTMVGVYGVSASTLRRAITGKTWAHVPFDQAL